MQGNLPIISRRVRVVKENESVMEDVAVVLEEPLSLSINGRQIAVLMRLPGMEKELTVGFCLSEGLVPDFSDIQMIHHCGQGLPVPGEELDEDGSVASRNEIQARVRPEALSEDARLDVVRLIRAGCGAVDVTRAELPLTPLAPGPQVDARIVLGLSRRMREAQQLHKAVGGVHGAALFDLEGNLVVLCEDVGRHNAVDKAIGYSVLRGIPLEDKILLCSGRLSYEMVTKVIRVRLPVLVSVSAPTALAVQIADTFGLSMVGYLRGGKMTLYTHPERIITASSPRHP